MTFLPSQHLSAFTLSLNCANIFLSPLKKEIWDLPSDATFCNSEQPSAAQVLLIPSLKTAFWLLFIITARNKECCYCPCSGNYCVSIFPIKHSNWSSWLQSCLHQSILCAVKGNICRMLFIYYAVFSFCSQPNCVVA